MRPTSNQGDLLGNRAFVGFAQQLLRRDDNINDLKMQLGQIERLQPDHNHVETCDAGTGLKGLIDEVNLDHQVFFDIYTPEQK